MANDLKSTARAQANIAFIKYWGNRDARLRLPANASLSMNLADLHTTTTVRFEPGLTGDAVAINGKAADPAAHRRVSRHLDLLRERFDCALYAQVDSINNFPMGAGIASSASAFAALTLAAVDALGLRLDERELSALARCGSGSAARSIPGGFALWHAGGSHDESFAESIAPPMHWDLVDLIAIVSPEHKRVGSTGGHARAGSSVLQSARIQGADERLSRAKAAILSRDFAELAQVAELDSDLMHAVMMTSAPSLFYWLPDSLAIMLALREWRERDGLQVFYTLDAGPNVHCICAGEDADEVASRLRQLRPGLDALRSGVGGGAVLLPGRD